jgi:hypothetical protein
MQEWVSGLDEPTRRQVQVQTSNVAKTFAFAPKSQKTLLVVKFKDGTVLFESIAAETFAKAIKKFGFLRVMDLKHKVCNVPLVSKQRPDTTYTINNTEGYFIMTHSNTGDKRDLLLKIAEELKEQITVDIVPA